MNPIPDWKSLIGKRVVVTYWGHRNIVKVLRWYDTWPSWPNDINMYTIPRGESASLIIHDVKSGRDYGVPAFNKEEEIPTISLMDIMW